MDLVASPHVKHDGWIDFALPVDEWTDIFEASLCDSIGQHSSCNCFGSILSWGIDCVDVDLCAERPMLFFMPLLAGPYNVLGLAAAP